MTPQQLLFPWKGMVRRLELGKRWWHRLAVVVFAVVLGITLLVTWGGMMAEMEPTNAEFDQSWHLVDLPAPPLRQGFQPADPYAAYGGKSLADTAGEARPADGKIDLTAGVVPIHYEVEMPDGKTREFVGKSRDEIRTEWDATLHELKVRQWLLSPVVAILMMLAMSYLLQSLYRVLLYVVYGSHFTPSAA